MTCRTGIHPLLLTGSAAGGMAASFCPAARTLCGGRRPGHFGDGSGDRSPLTHVALAAVLLSGRCGSRRRSTGPTSARALMQTLPSMLAMRASNGPREIGRRISDVRAARELIGHTPGTFLTDAYPLARIPPSRDTRALRLAPGPKPNIVFIMMESLRAEEVGVYGNSPLVSRRTSTFLRALTVSASTAPTAATDTRPKGNWVSWLALAGPVGDRHPLPPRCAAARLSGDSVVLRLEVAALDSQQRRDGLPRRTILPITRHPYDRWPRLSEERFLHELGFLRPSIDAARHRRPRSPAAAVRVDGADDHQP